MPKVSKSRLRSQLLSDSQRKDIARVLRSIDWRFTSLVSEAGLEIATDFRYVNLASLRVFPDENLTGYDFTGSNLAKADLRGVDLTRTCLDDADLSGADLRGANLSRLQRATLAPQKVRIGRWKDPAAQTARILAARDIELMQEAIISSPIVAAAFKEFPEAELVRWNRDNPATKSPAQLRRRSK
jgi:uncharacterized protein YjbI with pentapeptide repeats